MWTSKASQLATPVPPNVGRKPPQPPSPLDARLPDCIVVTILKMYDDDYFPHSFGCEVVLWRWWLEGFDGQVLTSGGAFDCTALVAVFLYVF